MEYDVRKGARKQESVDEIIWQEDADLNIKQDSDNGGIKVDEYNNEGGDSGGEYLILPDKERVEALIRALQKAIQLGWVK